MEQHDSVNHPSHYNAYRGLEIIDLTEQMNFNRGNAVKYIARAGLKNKDAEIQDLEKAAWYINREIERIRGAVGVDAGTDVYEAALEAMKAYDRDVLEVSKVGDEPYDAMRERMKRTVEAYGKITKLVCSSCDFEMKERRYEPDEENTFFYCENGHSSIIVPKKFLAQYDEVSLFDTVKKFENCPECGIVLSKDTGRPDVRVCPNMHGWMEYSHPLASGVWHPPHTLLERFSDVDLCPFCWARLVVKEHFQPHCPNLHGWMGDDRVWHTSKESVSPIQNLVNVIQNGDLNKSSCGRDGCVEHRIIEGQHNGVR